MIIFDLKTHKVLGNLNRMVKNISKDTKLTQELKQAHVEYIEKPVKQRLYSRTKFSRNTHLTNNKNTGVVAAIKRNIETSIGTGFSSSGGGVMGVTKSIIIGTGKIKDMDRRDPILKSSLKPRRHPKSPTHRLWRILEVGSRPHTIKARSGAMKKYGGLVFYWKRHKLTFRGVSVNHPGTRGRNYFLKGNSILEQKRNEYVANRKGANRQMKRAFNKYIKRFSK